MVVGVIIRLTPRGIFNIIRIQPVAEQTFTLKIERLRRFTAIHPINLMQQLWLAVVMVAALTGTVTFIIYLQVGLGMRVEHLQ